MHCLATVYEALRDGWVQCIKNATNVVFPHIIYIYKLRKYLITDKINYRMDTS